MADPVLDPSQNRRTDEDPENTSLDTLLVADELPKILPADADSEIDDLLTAISMTPSELKALFSSRELEEFLQDGESDPFDPVAGKESEFTSLSPHVQNKILQKIAAGRGGNFEGVGSKPKSEISLNDLEFDRITFIANLTLRLDEIEAKLGEMNQKLDNLIVKHKETLVKFDAAQIEHDEAVKERTDTIDKIDSSAAALAASNAITINREWKGKTYSHAVHEDKDGYYIMVGKDKDKRRELTPEEILKVKADLAAGLILLDEKSSLARTHAVAFEKLETCDIRVGAAAAKLAALGVEIEDQQKQLKSIKEQIAKTAEELKNVLEDPDIKKLTPEERAKHLDSRVPNIEKQLAALNEKAGMVGESMVSKQGLIKQYNTLGKCDAAISGNALEFVAKMDEFNKKYETSVQADAVLEKDLSVKDTAITELKTKLQQQSLEAAKTLEALKTSETELATIKAESAALENELRNVEEGFIGIAAAKTGIETERNTLSARAKEIEAMRDTVVGNISTSPYETRKDYLQEAYGGTIAFHKKNYAGMSDPSKGIPVVKTTDGREVFSSGEGLYTKGIGADGKEIKVPLNDPYEIAKANVQAWGKPPFRFANEGPDTNQKGGIGGFFKNIGDMVSHIGSDEKKAVAEMRVADAAASINKNLVQMDARIADLNQQEIDIGVKLAALTQTKLDIEEKNKLAAGKVEGLSSKLDTLQKEIEAGQNSIFSDIRSNIISPETLALLRESASPEFLAKIENEVLESNRRLLKTENDVIPVLNGINKLDAELVTINVPLHGNKDSSYVVYKDDQGKAFIIDNGLKYNISQFEDKEKLLTQIENQEKLGQKFGDDNLVAASEFAVLVQQRDIQLAEYQEQQTTAKALASAAKEVSGALAQRDRRDDGKTTEAVGTPALVYNEQLATYAGKIEAQIESGVIKAEDLDRVLADASPEIQKQIFDKLAEKGTQVVGNSTLLATATTTHTLSADGVLYVSGAKNEMRPPIVVAPLEKNEEVAAALAQKPKEETPDVTLAYAAKPVVTLTSAAGT